MTRLPAIAVFALTVCATLVGFSLKAPAARAQQPQEAEGCPRLIASGAPRIIRAAVGKDELALTFIGHATFVLETPAGLRVATDYNDLVRPDALPDVITMNRAHGTHFTNAPDPGIAHVLRGWNPAGGVAAHDVTIKDMRIRNVATNIRDWRGGTDYAGNSIFVFEASQICVAHLGHLHHELTTEHLKQLGRIDVALVPVDGGYTLTTEQMMGVIKVIQPRIVIPMHFFGQSTLGRFLTRASEDFPVETADAPFVILSRDRLPRHTKVLVLPGR